MKIENLTAILFDTYGTVVDEESELQRAGYVAVDDRQAVDDDAGPDSPVAGQDDRDAVVIGAVAGNIQDPSLAPVRIDIEQAEAVIDGAGNRRPHLDISGDGR